MSGRAKVRWHTAAPLACLLTAGCGAVGDATPPGGGTEGGRTSVRGEIVAQSDVEGIPDLAGEGGLVAAVPQVRASDLWAAAGATPPPGQESYAQFVLDRDGFERIEATVAEVDDDGRFELDVDPDDYLLCRVVKTFAGVRGCAAVRLPTDEVLRLTTGEAGFRVVPDGG